MHREIQAFVCGIRAGSLVSAKHCLYKRDQGAENLHLSQICLTLEAVDLCSE